MMPLWTMATRSVAWGWALVSLGAPWVAQRVWPMPTLPGSGDRSSKRFEIGDLALGPAPVDMAVDQGRDAGGIVAAIGEALQRLDQERGGGLIAENADDSTHGFDLLLLLRASRSRLGDLELLLHLAEQQRPAGLLLLAGPRDGQGHRPARPG